MSLTLNGKLVFSSLLDQIRNKAIVIPLGRSQTLPMGLVIANLTHWFNARTGQ